MCEPLFIKLYSWKKVSDHFLFRRNVLKFHFSVVFMAYISKHHLLTACIIKVHKIYVLLLGYGGCNKPHVNNVNFSES